MEIEEAFHAHLLAYTAFSDLIKNAVTPATYRLYPDEAPEGTPMNYVVYINISDVKIHTLTGQSEIESPVFQFTIYAATKANAKAIAKQIKRALKDFSGVMSGVEVQHVKLLNELCTKYTSPDGTTSINVLDLEFEFLYIRSE